MNITSAEAHDLAKELAALEHTTITDAVILSLREVVERRQEHSAATYVGTGAEADIPLG